MKIIFIAGPFRGDGSKKVKEQNIKVARDFAHIFIKNNIPYYSPHLNVDQEMAFLDIDKSKFAWDLNAEILRRSDALAVLPGYETSNGTKEEIENAKKRSLPIFYLSEENAIKDILNFIKND